MRNIRNILIGTITTLLMTPAYSSDSVVSDSVVSDNYTDQIKEMSLKSKLYDSRLKLIQSEAEYQKALNALEELKGVNAKVVAVDSSDDLKADFDRQVKEMRAEFESKEAPMFSIKKSTPEDIALKTLSNIYLISVYGNDKSDLKSDVMYLGGIITNLSKGDEIPGDWVIKSVSVNNKIVLTNPLVKGSREISLKSPSMITKELTIKQEIEFETTRMHLEIERQNLENASRQGK